MTITLKPATYEERKIFYKEEWNVDRIPDYILDTLINREFGFDHMGYGPNDRYKVFHNKLHLKRFIKVKKPYAAYASVAYYDTPQKRQNWQKAEFVFDVDAKDIPVRTCECKPGEVCEKCLSQAKEIVAMIKDTLTCDLGIKNINMVYSGRGYHIRVLDENIMTLSSQMRGEILQYTLGAKVPDITDNAKKLGFNNFQTFTLKFGYYKNFMKWSDYTTRHINKKTQLTNINTKLVNDIIKHRHLLPENRGEFRNKIGPIRYRKMEEAIARTNLAITDSKVSIDLKRILRLPTTLHSKVSMKSTPIKNLEKFNPFDDAVPKFVYERKNP